MSTKQKCRISRHILDAGCCYKEDSFRLSFLPCTLPEFFTVRFTPSVDFTAGDAITIKGRKFTIKTRTMEEPIGKLFSAGAVVQCDIDMEQELAFITPGGEAQGGGSGDTGVVSWAGKTGVVIPEIEDTTGLRAELDDMARAEDLAKYAKLDSPALITPTATTPPANASGDEVMTAAGLRTAMAGNLGTTEPLMDGAANAGTATTVARSDHRYPSDTSRIVAWEPDYAKQFIVLDTTTGPASNIYPHTITAAGTWTNGTPYTLQRDGFYYFAFNIDLPAGAISGLAGLQHTALNGSTRMLTYMGDSFPGSGTSRVALSYGPAYFHAGEKLRVDLHAAITGAVGNSTCRLFHYPPKAIAMPQEAE